MPRKSTATGCLSLLVIGPSILLAMFTGWGVFDINAWWYRRTMRGKKRYITQKELRARIVQTPGTILVDHPSPGMGLRYLWWTPDDILALAPAPPPEKNYYLDTGEPSVVPALHPFDEWLWTNYLCPEAGKALKVGSWNLHPKDAKLQSRFPRCKILGTWTGIRHVIQRASKG